MPYASEATRSPIQAKDRIIVALDVDSTAKAEELIDKLSDSVGAFKIGMQLFTAAGPSFVRKVAEKGINVFLDLKYHDIPNTVARAGIEAAKLGVWMFNVHASGGGEMMRRTFGDVAETCDKFSIARPLIIAVTVLTSSNQETLAETGISATPMDQVVRLAQLTSNCGLDGIVASPLEVTAVRSQIHSCDFVIVTPGIRSESATSDDQKRVTSAGAAASNGSDYLVIGRPITAAPDRLSAVESIVKEIEMRAEARDPN
ncbi:MAG: orotidine-5'-phosphate decarboxylase [Pyrinomonadaceae bacterium]|nr:orotidine-5'-phosphate decarboxylase [Pyrinomonadaceae bacterium]